MRQGPAYLFDKRFKLVLGRSNTHERYMKHARWRRDGHARAGVRFRIEGAPESVVDHCMPVKARSL